MSWNHRKVVFLCLKFVFPKMRPKMNFPRTHNQLVFLSAHNWYHFYFPAINSRLSRVFMAGNCLFLLRVPSRYEMPFAFRSWKVKSIDRWGYLAWAESFASYQRELNPSWVYLLPLGCWIKYKLLCLALVITRAPTKLQRVNLVSMS